DSGLDGRKRVVSEMFAVHKEDADGWVQILRGPLLHDEIHRHVRLGQGEMDPGLVVLERTDVAPHGIRLRRQDRHPSAWARRTGKHGLCARQDVIADTDLMKLPAVPL